MKKLMICLEIQGLAENENGEPRPAGCALSWEKSRTRVFRKNMYS